MTTPERDGSPSRPAQIRLAALILSCAAALLCGAIGRVPPIAGLTVAGEEAARLQLAHESVPARGPIALVNSFASGGALASIVLRAGTAI